jgi:hypothetical protein
LSARPDAKGERLVWLAATVVDRLAAMRGPGESYSDVILRLVDLEIRRRASGDASPRQVSQISD